MKSSDLTPVTRNYVTGKRRDANNNIIKHVHVCSQGHEWECDSPYCESPGKGDDCPEHGGLEPIIQGREPWRGR